MSRSTQRGWRRSGSYCYVPHMSRTCCPQYTIRLAANDFTPSKQHRQVAKRFRTFLTVGAKSGSSGYGPADEAVSTTESEATAGPSEQPKSEASTFDIDTFFDECSGEQPSNARTFKECSGGQLSNAHTFKVGVAALMGVLLHPGTSLKWNRPRLRRRSSTSTGATRWQSTRIQTARSSRMGFSASCATVHCGQAL
jgi:hypothetical protein